MVLVSETFKYIRLWRFSKSGANELQKFKQLMLKQKKVHDCQNALSIQNKKTSCFLSTSINCQNFLNFFRRKNFPCFSKCLLTFSSQSSWIKSSSNKQFLQTLRVFQHIREELDRATSILNILTRLANLTLIYCLTCQYTGFC